jgi:hypothetical protein
MVEYKTFEDELDAIRLAIYEKIKDMTPEEEITYLKSRSDPIIKEYGFRVVNQIKNERREKEAVLS